MRKERRSAKVSLPPPAGARSARAAGAVRPPLVDLTRGHISTGNKDDGDSYYVTLAVAFVRSGGRLLQQCGVKVRAGAIQGNEQQWRTVRFGGHVLGFGISSWHLTLIISSR